MSRRCDPRKRAKVSDNPDDEEYLLKRQKNNHAVNRTRQRKRQEENETLERVEELRKENAELEKKVDGLQKELSFLKEMFVAYATSNRKKIDEESDAGVSKRQKK